MVDQRRAEIFQRIVGEYDTDDPRITLKQLVSIASIEWLPNNLLYIVKPTGEIPTHEQIEVIFSQIREFYTRISTDEIAYLNARFTPDPEPPERPGEIYVMHFADRYKIGFTRNGVQKRHYQIQAELRRKQLDGILSIVYSKHVQRPESLERQLHARFASKRVADEMEWFWLTSSDLEKVEAFMEQQS
jgi:hypothetical protein